MLPPHFLRRRLRVSKETPSESAFCRTAPSVRLNARPIVRAVVFFAIVFSWRISPTNHGRFFRRVAIVILLFGSSCLTNNIFVLLLQYRGYTIWLPLDQY
jgi:hypothetical protein